MSSVAAAAATAADNTTARGVLAKKGFDPDDLTQMNDHGWPPILYFCYYGNVTMVRYLIFRRGDEVDCRWTDRTGWFPLFWAAGGGYLEICHLLWQHGRGVHADLQKRCNAGTSPLRIALQRGHFEVVQWLLQNGALAPRDAVDGGGIDVMVMRTDLSPTPTNGSRVTWDYDKRRTVLSWAHNVVTAHENITVVLTGTHSKSSSSPLHVLQGKSGVLQVIADSAGYPTRHEVRLCRALFQRLSAFIDAVPFVQPNLAMGVRIGTTGNSSYYDAVPVVSNSEEELVEEEEEEEEVQAGQFDDDTEEEEEETEDQRNLRLGIEQSLLIVDGEEELRGEDEEEQSQPSYEDEDDDEDW